MKYLMQWRWKKLCNWLNMFYFETRCFSSITVRHDGGKFVENFSTIKKSLGAISRTSAQFTNKVRKRTGELGSTQLSELRLGEFNIRSRRFYEMKLMISVLNKTRKATGFKYLCKISTSLMRHVIQYYV